MQNEFNEYYQYNSCISRGICSLNPRISSLQTVLVLYLRLFAKYAQGLDLEKSIKNFLLNTISITIYNPEFNENSFIFDKTDLLGEEPYGIVYDFFEGFKIILEEIKNEFPKIEITGHISINDIKFSCCYKESVKTTKRSSKIQFKKCKY